MAEHLASHYQQVAEVYDEALEEGDPPTESVRVAFGVPYSTAARWVRRTRALGLLPPTSGGRPAGNTRAQDTDRPPEAEERSTG